MTIEEYKKMNAVYDRASDAVKKIRNCESAIKLREDYLAVVQSRGESYSFLDIPKYDIKMWISDDDLKEMLSYGIERLKKTKADAEEELSRL